MKLKLLKNKGNTMNIDNIIKKRGTALLLILTILNVVILLINLNKDIIFVDKSKHKIYKISDEFYNKYTDFLKNLRSSRKINKCYIFLRKYIL